MYTLLPSWLAVTAAVFFPTATAFYPYHFDDISSSGSSSSVRSRHVSSNANANDRSLTLPLRRVVAPRQNSYTIVNSNTPSQQNSVAIDQDGNDISYMVAVTFGTSKKVYHLLLDSAASNTWIMAATCSSAPCKSHNTLGTGDSSSLKTNTQTFSLTYGTGSVNGTLATDTFHIGSLSTSLTFGLANGVSQDFQDYPMDGIMGLGRGISSGNAVAAPQVMDALSSAKLISSKLVGIHLSRAKDNNPDGELDLGSINTNRFTGDLNYISAVDSSTTGFWEAPITDAGVDGKLAGLTGRSAILDTGTSYILMPQADAVALHAMIPGSQQDGETFSVPCSATSTVQFSFNKISYNISTADWKGGKLSSGLCTSNIIGRQTFGATQWLVGDVFLKNVYTVFDFDNKRIGLGVKSGSSGSSSGSSAGVSGTANANAVASTAGGPSPTGKGSSSSSSSSTGVTPGASAAPDSKGQKGSNGAARAGPAMKFSAVGAALVFVVVGVLL